MAPIVLRDFDHSQKRLQSRPVLSPRTTLTCNEADRVGGLRGAVPWPCGVLVTRSAEGRSPMLLAYRLVRLIETRADELADGVWRQLQASEKTCEFAHMVPAEDFHAAVYEIYTHLGEWVMGRSEEDIARRYTAIGRRRASQGVALSQLNWAIVLTREHLWEFLQGED